MGDPINPELAIIPLLVGTLDNYTNNPPINAWNLEASCRVEAGVAEKFLLSVRKFFRTLFAGGTRVKCQHTCNCLLHCRTITGSIIFVVCSILVDSNAAGPSIVCLIRRWWTHIT